MQEKYMFMSCRKQRTLVKNPSTFLYNRTIININDIINVSR